jgi:hydroxypyruvate isomerase
MPMTETKPMPHFAANLSMMFTEVPFAERFAAAARAGFDAVECLFPYELPPETLGTLLRDNGLTQALFNMPPGDWAAGERGLATLQARGDAFRRSVATALTYALASGCKTLHMMAGNRSAGAPDVSRQSRLGRGPAGRCRRDRGHRAAQPARHARLLPQ